MSSFGKKVKGTLKLAAIGLPFALVGGAVAGMIAIPTASMQKTQAVYDEVRNTEIVQELYDQELEKIETAFLNGSISAQNYKEYRDYINSNEFIQDIIKINTDLKGYQTELNNAQLSILSTLLTVIPAALGLRGIVDLFSKESGYERKYALLFDSAIEDFTEKETDDEDLPEKAENNNRQNNQDINEHYPHDYRAQGPYPHDYRTEEHYPHDYRINEHPEQNNHDDQNEQNL